MAKITLMDNIQNMDIENFNMDTFGASQEFDYESFVTMDIEEAELQSQAEEAAEAVDAFEEASEIAVEVQEEIQETLENIDDMSPVAVGKALGAIAEKASEIADVAEAAVDAEAMDADYKAGARLELEAISDSIKKAWEAVKQFFRSVWAKIKQLIQNVGLWIVNGKKKTDAVAKLMAGKSSDTKSELTADDQPKIVNKITSAAGVLGSLVEVADFTNWVGSLTKMDINDKLSISVSDRIKKAYSYYKNLTPLDKGMRYKVARFDGSNLSLVVLKTMGSTTGYHAYNKVSLSAYGAKFGMAEFKANVGDVTKGSVLKTMGDDFIKLANEAHKGIADLKDKLYAEMATVGKEVDGDVEKVKLNTGIFKLVWTSTIGEKSLEQLTANEKVRLVRNRAAFTSRYTFDVLYGLNGAANGFTRAAAICAGYLKDTGAAKESEDKGDK